MTPENAPSLSWVEKLEAEHGADWPALRKARVETALQRARVERALSDNVAPDTENLCSPLACCAVSSAISTRRPHKRVKT